MKILFACEESQTCCIAFRNKGHDAYSNDLLPCSGGHPEWHLQCDCFEAIALKRWDMIFAFPPCTHLSGSGAAWFEKKQNDGRQREAIDFFLRLTDFIKVGAIENPVGIMSTYFKKPDQIIHPYYFGDSAQKRTCLWLFNLPKLFHAKERDLFNEITHVDKGEMYVSPRGKKMPKWYSNTTSKIRSKTFLGIARAMADQWG